MCFPDHEIKKLDSTANESARMELVTIGMVSSSLVDPAVAPHQGHEGAPDAFIVLDATYIAALDGVKVGAELIVITWFHKAKRDTLKVHPRRDANLPLTGVFATRSPHRPNPLGLHRVTVRRIEQERILVGPIEAVDGTPVVDIKSA